MLIIMLHAMQIMDNNPIVKSTMAHLLHTAFEKNEVDAHVMNDL